MRNESLAAKQNQQTILQWSLATVGVGAAAVVAIAAATLDSAGASRGWLLLGVCLVFGIAIPLLVACAFGIWLGEVDRMERAGLYLREREHSFGPRPQGAINPSDPRWSEGIFWERLINEAGPGSPYRKNVIGSAASCMLFTGLFISSAVASLVPVVWSEDLISLLTLHGCVAWWGWIVCLIVIFLLVFVPRVLDLRDEASGENSR